MTRWEEDQEQIEYLKKWREEHKYWIVRVYHTTLTGCQYWSERRFISGRVARLYAFICGWVHKVELEKEQ